VAQELAFACSLIFLKTYNIYSKDCYKMKKLSFLLALWMHLDLGAQGYPPPAGQPGSTAMYRDSSAFAGWATGCRVKRGYQDISNPGAGFATAGDSTMATGKPGSNGTVSLGDGGYAICTFAFPIKNGSGPDFAVFENALNDTFLELAFVEVSSDGKQFFRFPSHSLTDTVSQTNGFGPTDATKINNLAGKYREGFGTTFDLQELAATPGLDINLITHVLVRDVVGSLQNAYATRDSHQNKINDPWPTPFPQGGFDLDGIGVIHQETVLAVNEIESYRLAEVFPNPVAKGNNVHLRVGDTFLRYEISDTAGNVLRFSDSKEIITSELPKGIYMVRIICTDANIVKKMVIY
jgi:hypothetical protein